MSDDAPFLDDAANLEALEIARRALRHIGQDEIANMRTCKTVARFAIEEMARALDVPEARLAAPLPVLPRLDVLVGLPVLRNGVWETE